MTVRLFSEYSQSLDHPTDRFWAAADRRNDGHWAEPVTTARNEQHVTEEL